MKYTHFIIVLCTLLLPSLIAQSQSNRVKNGSVQSWVEVIGFNQKAIPPVEQESSYYYLLIDEQENVALQESYIHYAYRILSNEGLQQMSDLSVQFDPSYEQVIFHNISIHRNGEVIDKLPKKINTLQRENSMDRYLYDGSLTAIVNLTDMRIGDVVEYSYTRKGYNPVYEGYFSRRISLNYSLPFEKYYQRLLVPTSLKLTFKEINTTTKPKIINEKNGLSYTWEVSRAKGLNSDNNEPEWYNPYETVLLTNFSSWSEVAQWAAKRYVVTSKDHQLVRQKILPTIKGNTKEEFTLQAIRFVQDEIRYLGFESGLNSHKPHSPMQVYEQRFGDCKDKSLLLATILRVNDIEAYPVLVHTNFKGKVGEQLPSINSFNHCIVQVKLNNDTFYVDPTISSQGGDFKNSYFPNYEKGLVVVSAKNGLVDFPRLTDSGIEEELMFDLASIGGEGMMRVETIYTGSEADYQRSYFANNTLESIQKNYLTYYGNLYPDIEKFELVEVEDDRLRNTFKVREHYKIPTFWKPNDNEEGKIYCELHPQGLETHFSISKSVNRTAPYRLSYPLNYSNKIRVNLPEEWTIKLEEETIENDYYRYTYEVLYEGTELNLVTTYKTKVESVPVAGFSTFVTDHEKMYNNLTYSLTYDKTISERSGKQWPGVIVTVLSLAFGVFLVIWLYNKYDPIPENSEPWAEPIGGWLILVGIGISFTPLRIIYDLVTVDYLLSGQAWLAFWYNKNYTYSIFVFLEHIYNVVYLLFALLMVVLFFQRRSSVPRLASILYGVTCLVTIFDSFVAVQIDPSSELNTKDIIRAIIAAAIWIPYFHISERVKRTFVIRKNPTDNNGAEVISSTD